MLETQRGNYDNLVSTSTIDFIGPLVLAVGIIVILYGVLMLLLARRLEPGTSSARRQTAPEPADRRMSVSVIEAVQMGYGMIASSTEWQVGLALGIVVIAVAAVIVIVIVLLALQDRRSRRRRPSRRSRCVRAADGRARRHRADQRLGRADPARRPGAAEGGGREMTLAAISSNTLLGGSRSVIGLGAALVVAILLAVLVGPSRSIERSVDGLLEIAGQGRPRTRRTSRSSRRPRPCWR